jgi:hypothetical protein
MCLSSSVRYIRVDLRCSGILRSIEYCTGILGQPISPTSRVKESSWTSWTWKMGLIGCPEMSVQNYHSTLCNISEDCRSHLHYSRSLNSYIRIRQLPTSKLKANIPMAVLNIQNSPLMMSTRVKLIMIC